MKLSKKQLLAKSLNDELEASPIWSKICTGYDKQFCFKNYSIEDIITDNDTAKKWYKEQSQYWCINLGSMFNQIIKE